MTHAGKTAIVTGAAQGIGEAYARGLAHLGALLAGLWRLLLFICAAFNVATGAKGAGASCGG